MHVINIFLRLRKTSISFIHVQSVFQTQIKFISNDKSLSRRVVEIWALRHTSYLQRLPSNAIFCIKFFETSAKKDEKKIKMLCNLSKRQEISWIKNKTEQSGNNNYSSFYVRMIFGRLHRRNVLFAMNIIL